MSTIVNDKEYSVLYESFNKECKRVEIYQSRSLTKNVKLKIEYRQCLVKIYNGILKFLNPQINTLSSEDKIIYENKIITHLVRLKQCFQILGLEYTFDNSIQALIDIDKVTEEKASLTDVENNSDSNSDSTISASSTESAIDTSLKRQQNIEQKKNKQTEQIPPRSRHNSRSSESNDGDDPDNFGSSSSENSDNEMAKSTKHLMQLANATINYRYDGDP